MKKYQIIYADPPWRYDRIGVQGSAEKIYPTMTLEDICNLPVADITDTDAVLFLWATFPKLREALQTIKSWAFSIKASHLSGSKEIRTDRAGFTVSASGRGETLKFACLQQRGIRNEDRARCINLSSVRCAVTAKSRTKPEIRYLSLWVTCRELNCLRGEKQTVGMCGGTKWKAIYH